MNNIAEGFEKRSNKDFKKYLVISKGSCGEVRSMLYLAKDFKYIDQKDFELFYGMTIEISKIISGFIKSLNLN
jgi:four helix bundle protein